MNLFRLSAILAFSIIASGCSLLEIKLDSQSVPLTQQELNLRMATREYTQLFFTSVEATADTISTHYPATDTAHQSYVLLWKINAEEGIQGSAYQSSPLASLIDSWVFSQQMNDFYQENGQGGHLFESTLAAETSKKLLSDISNIAKSLLSKKDYQFTAEFVKTFSAEHAFNDLSFRRTPAYRDWLIKNNVNAADIINTMGTMPEAMNDVSDKLSLMSEQTPKLMTWKAQLIALNSNISSKDLTDTLASMRATSASIQDFVINNPEYMQDLAQQMAIQLQPLVNDIDIKTDDKLAKLSVERIALETMVAHERKELIQMVERERNAIASIISEQRQQLAVDLDTLSQNVVTLAMDKLIELIKSTIIYFILFIFAIFFAPLGLGFWLGKRTQNKKQVPIEYTKPS